MTSYVICPECFTALGNDPMPYCEACGDYYHYADGFVYSSPLKRWFHRRWYYLIYNLRRIVEVGE